MNNFPGAKSRLLNREVMGFRLISLLGLLAAIVVPFLPIMLNGFVNWDDDSNFLQNQEYRGLGWVNLRWAWTTFLLDVYQPLAWILLELEYVIWGMRAWGYHLVSLVLHLAVCVMLLFFTIELLARINGQANETRLRWSALAATLLFAVHPLRVEVVAWVSCQPYLPCLLLYIFSLWAYLKAHPVNGGFSPRWLGIAWLSMLAALLFKAVAISLPLVMLILDGYPLKRLGTSLIDRFRPRFLRVWFEKVPFLGLSLGFAIFAVRARNASGEVVPTQISHLSTRLIRAGYGIGYYLLETVLPLRPSIYHPLPTESQLYAYPYLTMALVVGGVTLLLAILARRNPGMNAVWMAYIAILLPHLGLAVNDTKLVAERYCYAASIPWVILFASVLSSSWVWRWKKGVTAAIVGIAFLSSVLTWNQCRVWGDTEQLLRQALANTDPHDPFLLNNLGAELQEQGKVNEAESCFRSVIDQRPDDFGSHNNLGLILLQRNQPGQAAECFRRAISIEPKFAEAHKNLGVALDRLGETDQAESEYRTAVTLDPTFSVAYAALAVQEARRGRLTEAIDFYARAVQHDPGQADWQAALGTLHARVGQLDQAVVHLRIAVRLKPVYLDARANLGMALADSGKIKDAEIEFERVLRTRPDHPTARRGLSLIRQRLSGSGR